MYTVIRTRFLTGITRESYCYRETPQNPSAFYSYISYKSFNFYFYKHLIHCLLKTQLLEDRQSFTPYYKVPLTIEWHHLSRVPAATHALVEMCILHIVQHDTIFVPLLLSHGSILYEFLIGFLCSESLSFSHFYIRACKRTQ